MTKISNYVFKNNNLLKTALTTPSYANETNTQSYQRMEFLGDSILDFLVGKMFYKKFPNFKESQLTKMRSYYVCQDFLSKIFDKLNLETLVLKGKSCREITPSIKCDIIESIVGAMYLDSNLDIVEKFILENFNFEYKYETDCKSLLKEKVESLFHSNEVVYNLLKKEGQSHNPIFTVEVCVKNKKCTAQGLSKKEAEENCAKEMLEILNRRDD